jgi:lactoylglutathione lyase
VTVTGITASHLGLCVTDLERSLAFYCEGLGFEQGVTYPIDNTFADTLEVPRDVVLTSQFISVPGMAIELLAYESPAVEGRPSTQRNQLGITHLSFYVDDVDAVAERLVALGGTVIESTRTTLEGIDLLFLSDPDGTRVELMKAG